MNIFYRSLIALGLAVGLIVVHYLFFFLPLDDFFFVYLILFNPKWFRDFLNKMAKD